MTTHPIHGRWKVDGAPRRADLKLDGERLAGTVDGHAVEAQAMAAGPGEVVLRVGGRRVLAVLARTTDGWWVSIDGRAVLVQRADAHGGDDAGPSASADPFAVSPMTGVVTKVHVAVGAAVGKGAPLFAVEAMKMEYVVRADRDVVVAELRAKAGERVAVGAVIVTFREDAAKAP